MIVVEAFTMTACTKMCLAYWQKYSSFKGFQEFDNELSEVKGNGNKQQTGNIKYCLPASKTGMSFGLFHFYCQRFEVVHKNVHYTDYKTH